MNENLILVEILKDCPKGTKLYSTIYGYVTLFKVQNSGRFPIKFMKSDGICNSLTARGLFSLECEGECVLFPSKDQRDWSKFKVKKPKFDSKTLEHFDRIIARIDKQGLWCCELFSFIQERTSLIRGCGEYYKHCMPYNDDTKHLVGTNKEAPEYYRYWED